MRQVDLEKIHPYFVDKELMQRKIFASRVTSCVTSFLSSLLKKKGFVEILPVVISPITDPLMAPENSIKFEIYGLSFQLCKSMIFHKQIAVLSLPKIFVFSPNVRIEIPSRKHTGRHLYEFVQLDVEAKYYTREKVVELAEEMLVKVIAFVKEKFEREFKYYGRELSVFKRPFPRLTWDDAIKRYGENFEEAISFESKTPVWIIDFPIHEREFYYREREDKIGYNMDMDLIYPEGFGEAISGGEREWKFEKILSKLERKKIEPSHLEFYLRIAKIGLKPSAGFGMGVERLVRFLTGFRNISEVKLFPKIPEEAGI